MITAPARNDVTKRQQPDRWQQDVVELERAGTWRVYDADNRVDGGGGERQAQAIIESPGKRSNDDGEEKEIVEDTVTRKRDQRQIPDEIEPGNNLVSRDWIAAHGKVIDHQSVKRIKNERNVSRSARGARLRNAEYGDEQRRGAEHHAHACDQAQVDPLF